MTQAEQLEEWLNEQIKDLPLVTRYRKYEDANGKTVVDKVEGYIFREGGGSVMIPGDADWVTPERLEKYEKNGGIVPGSMCFRKEDGKIGFIALWQFEATTKEEYERYTNG